jgi:hypothetical protein
MSSWWFYQPIDYVNETKRLSENKRRVAELQTKIVGTINLAPTLISGWIWKRSKTLKQWRRRYVVLSGEELAYYRQIDENMKPEVLALQDHMIHVAVCLIEPPIDRWCCMNSVYGK